MASGWDAPQADSAPRFVLLGELASGGMGSVDLARMMDAWGERVVAMKRVHPQFSRDAEFVQMFRDEIRLTHGLRHPNVVELVGWGEDDEGPYLVMELVEGAPLAEIAYRAKREGRRLPDELVAWVAARVCDGLYAAHTLAGSDGQPLGIVHRDITPSNVLIGFDGSIKITDFGIAKAAASSNHTRTGVVKGKVEYMSPEHALRRAVDGRSDLYSLGVVLFEILRGKPPIHGGSDLELLKRVAYEPIPPLASVVPDVNPELAAIVDRLLAKDLEQRPPDGATVAHELDEWLRARRLRPRALQEKLAEHATRLGGARRRKLDKLMSAEGLEIGSSSSWRDPKRVRASAPPQPGTFMRLADASGTRAVVVPSSPVLAPPLPAGASAELVPAPPSAEPGASSTRRVITMPPPPIVESAITEQPVIRSAHLRVSSRRARWTPVIAGVAVGCALVAVVVLLSFGAARSAAQPPAIVEAVPNEPATIETPISEPVDPAPIALPVPEPEPVVEEAATEPAPSSAASRPPPTKRPTRAGQQRPPASKVQDRRRTPCTPDRFDYPACR